jgi:predicted Zn-dependent protease
MFTVTSTRKVLLTTLVLGAALAACEDVTPPAPKPAPTAATEPPKPAELPPPPKVAVTSPAPVVEPEIKKTEPITGDDGESAMPADALTGARKLLAAGDTERALKLAKVAVGKTPKRSAAWNMLGRVQLQMGKRKDAITSFEKAVELNPRNSYAQNNLGLALIYDKQYAKAVDALEEAVEMEPVEGYMWNNLGMAYEQLDRLEEARDAYGKAAEMESDHARDSLARLKGVTSVIRTARVETDKKIGPETKADDTTKPTTDTKDDKDSTTITQ